VVAAFLLAVIITPTDCGSPLPEIFLTGFYWLVLAPPVVVLYRWIRTGQLRRRLAGLSSDQRDEVLRPLSSERGDTRKIVAPLLRDLGAATELIPAPVPSGRGDEASPAEEVSITNPEGRELQKHPPARSIAWDVLVGTVAFIYLCLIFVPIFAVHRGKDNDPSIPRLYNLMQGLQLYADDYDGCLPPMQDPQAVRRALAPSFIREYAEGSSTSEFVNPRTGQPYQANPALSGKKLADLQAHAPSTVVFYDLKPERSGRRHAITVDERIHLHDLHLQGK
jgi:hypothetical protein